MERHLLLFIQKQTTNSGKDALIFLRDKNVKVLAQYDDTALEVLVTDKQFKTISGSKLFSSVHEGLINAKELGLKSREEKEIVAAWNINQKPASRDIKQGDPNKGISWGDKRFDEPMPHSKLTGDFFLTTLKENKIEVPKTRKIRSRSISGIDFSSFERALTKKIKDPTKAYHLARLAVTNPELKETIEGLSLETIEELFKIPKQKRALGERGVGAEETCWRMNGEISIGVVFVESSRSDGPKFTATERTTLRSEVQTGLNWLASQHPTGNLTWVFNYQYVSINVANGNNNSAEDYWRNPAMQAVSYNGNSNYTGDWNGVANYRKHMRENNESAHAIVIFITPYGTDWHAYASNSRFTLANRNNWGGWGINTIDAITAHEICHLFGAADEYTGSGTPCNSCTSKHGCSQTVNGNCKSCAAGGGVPCIMDQNSLQICSFTRAQIGWPVLTSPRLPAKTPVHVVSRSANKLDIFVTDVNKNIMTAAWEPAFTDGWRGWWALNGGKARAGAPVIPVSRSTDKLDAFVIGTDNKVYTAAWEPTFKDWWHGWWLLNQGMAAPGAAVTAVSRSKDKLDVFVVGTDGYVYTAAWEPGFTSWRGWWRIGNIKVPQGAYVHAVSRSTDKLDIFVTDVNGRVMTAAWEPAFKDGWHGWWHVQGGLAAPGASVTAVSRSKDKLDIFVTGTDGRVWTAAWQAGFTSWKGWWVIGSIKLPQGSAVHAVSRSTDKLDIFATDVNSKIHTAAWEPAFTSGWKGWWALNGGMAAPGAPVTAVSRSKDKLDVFVTGLDGRVWTAAWEPAFTDWWHGWWPIGL